MMSPPVPSEGESDHEPLLCLVTCPNHEVAETVARTLVVERLAACVNMLSNVRSIYRWNGHISDEAEVLCMVKTTRAMYERLRDRVVQLHPYDIPEVVALRVDDVHGPYLDWLRSSVGDEAIE